MHQKLGRDLFLILVTEKRHHIQEILLKMKHFEWGLPKRLQKNNLIFFLFKPALVFCYHPSAPLFTTILRQTKQLISALPLLVNARENILGFIVTKTETSNIKLAILLGLILFSISCCSHRSLIFSSRDSFMFFWKGYFIFCPAPFWFSLNFSVIYLI